MHEAAPSALTAWSNFYVIIGSSAAALTGLLFVVITLVAGDRSRNTSDGVSTFTTPTVVHFSVALFISAVLSAPWSSLIYAGVVLALTGFFGIAYIGLVIHRMRTRLGPLYRPQIDDWISYGIVPLIAYGTIFVAAVRLAAAPAGTLFALAGGTMLLIFLGIHNAWDVVTFIAIDQGRERDAARASAEPPPQEISS
ncbi:MAG: hypothetical protein QOJ39_3140 [Candidatus Eremiobacteraeota bacterium]|jgi:hypothetical protein|nr:hypothetical protein [Candidatus Eremiobacteraeota bacterium]MEA2721276.1 hypothetical protein [Candidatus Eremiobacteraeota bacterium]